jgi:hypothetical protein
MPIPINTPFVMVQTPAITEALALIAGGSVTLTPDFGAQTLTIAASGGGVTPAALTKTDDTNVTLTLTGTPATALLQAVNVAAGWTGTLGLARGGTAANLSATGGAGQYLKQISSGAAITVGTIPASDIASGAALTKTDDTNVTLTLGGTPSAALLAATSLTLGWTGTLAAGRLNAAVVQAVTNDTNVTGSIAAQTLTLGWTGTLAVARGGTGTGTAFTAGSVIFAGASGVYSQDNANLFWDTTNKRLGIGTASPNDVLDVHGILRITGLNTAPNYLRLDNTANSGGKLWRIGDTGAVTTGKFSIYDQTDGVVGLVINPSGGIGFSSNTDPGLGGLAVKGSMAVYNNITTAGWGVPAIYGSGRVTGQTANAVTVATYTTPAADGSYMIAASMNVTAFTSGTAGLQVTFTDETGNTISIPLNISGQAGPFLNVISSATPTGGAVIQIRVKASTAITITSVITGTLTYNAEAYILQLG